MYQKKFLWIINRVKIGFQEQNFLVETTKEIKGNEIEYENKKNISSRTIRRVSLKTAFRAVWLQKASPTA